MKKIMTLLVLTGCLAACSSNSGTSNSTMYGEIKGGVETSKKF